MSGAKIIIKPRLNRGGSSAPASASTPSSSRNFQQRNPHPGPSKSPSEVNDELENDADATESASGEVENEEGEVDGMDIDEDGDDSAAATPNAGDKEGGAVVIIPASKARGRPRGRGRGSGIVSGIITPRGRGRGRGRVRGRGRGGPLTIRLPKRGDEGEGVDDEGAGGEGTPAEGVEELAAEKEPPAGGGKPFRRIHGKVYIIENDEFITEDDDKGDTKIDKQGNLLGGRRFKASTFTLPNRHPERVYMLAIDAARTSGFRDSLYYFRRNLLALKLNATQPEKDYLIGEGKLGSHLRTRSVTLITARSAYKLHGAKMIIDGKWVEDDYFESKSLEEITARGLNAGDPVGELPDPQLYASENAAQAAANARERGAPAGGGGGGNMGVYRAGGPTTIFGGSGWGPYSDGPLNAVRKGFLNREGVGEENWMWVAATRVGEATEEWAKIRKEARKAWGGLLGDEGGFGEVAGSGMTIGGNIKGKGKEKEEEEEEEEEDGEQGESPTKRGDNTDRGKKRKIVKEVGPLGVYEPHSGVIFYRSDTQPTRSRWEFVPGSDAHERQPILGGTKAGNGAWGIAWVDTIMELPRPEEIDPGPREVVSSEISGTFA